MMKIRHEIIHSNSPQLERRLRGLENQLDLILARQETIMATLDEVLTKVSGNDDRLDSIVDLIAGLKTQLDEVLSGVTLPPAVQEKVDAIFNQAVESSAKIDTALNTNVPPA